MKMLHPYSEEVWELRSRDRKPSWRVFCRFALPDVLIALNASSRSDLGAEGSVEWREAIRDCKTRWRRLFPTFPPFCGAQASDYITENVVVVGDLP